MRGKISPQALVFMYFSYRMCKFRTFTLLLVALVSTVPALAFSATVQEAIGIQQDSQKQAARSQEKVDRLSDKQQELWQKYTASKRQLANLKIYNENLSKLTRSQVEDIESLKQQILQVEVTAQGIVPLMIKMVDTLEQFLDLDVPFLPQERKQRIISLKELLDRADVTAAEKYRRVMEAYQVETEYGRTIEAYTDKLADDDSKTVEFLRIGRIALLYVTLDKAEAGRWDATSKSWQVLSSDNITSISKGLKMARKQAAPELLLLPINKWEAVQ